MEDILLMELIETISHLTNYVACFRLTQTIILSQIAVVLQISAVAQLKDQVESTLSRLNVQKLDNAVMFDLTHHLNLSDQIVQQSLTQRCPVYHLDG